MLLNSRVFLLPFLPLAAPGFHPLERARKARGRGDYDFHDPASVGSNACEFGVGCRRGA